MATRSELSKLNPKCSPKPEISRDRCVSSRPLSQPQDPTSLLGISILDTASDAALTISWEPAQMAQNAHAYPAPNWHHLRPLANSAIANRFRTPYHAAGTTPPSRLQACSTHRSLPSTATAMAISPSSAQILLPTLGFPAHKQSPYVLRTPSGAGDAAQLHLLQTGVPSFFLYSSFAIPSIFYYT